MAKPITVTDQEFAEIVLQADELVMVNFWATYCAACRMVALLWAGVAHTTRF